jgi:hypothetical protein
MKPLNLAEEAKMRSRIAFKRLMLGARVGLKGLEHIESSYDYFMTTDYASLPLYQREVKHMADMLRDYYGEGTVN